MGTILKSIPDPPSILVTSLDPEMVGVHHQAVDKEATSRNYLLGQGFVESLCK